MLSLIGAVWLWMTNESLPRNDRGKVARKELKEELARRRGACSAASAG